ncbi:hypothetical protein SAY86_008515 [Trapa natans]|uniref:Uncharacterized protein n=1 Tax=Trapa natans TaxID=22666 RepID=A0AAN7KAB3_TRANT|nr:hypothetical protein SAY86_008515 [Trapa natans]
MVAVLVEEEGVDEEEAICAAHTVGGSKQLDLAGQLDAERPCFRHLSGRLEILLRRKLLQAPIQRRVQWHEAHMETMLVHNLLEPADEIRSHFDNCIAVNVTLSAMKDLFTDEVNDETAVGVPAGEVSDEDLAVGW